MSGALDTVLAGTRVVIRTTLLPDFVVELDDKSPPGPLSQLLKPQVSLERGGLLLYRAEPYGAPQAPALLIPALLVVLAAVLLLVLG